MAYAPINDYEKGLSPAERGTSDNEGGLTTAQYAQPGKDEISDRELWLHAFALREDLQAFIDYLRPLAISRWRYRRKINGKWPGFFYSDPARVSIPADKSLLFTRPLDKTRVVALLDAMHPNSYMTPWYLDNSRVENLRHNYDNGKKAFYLKKDNQEPIKVIDLETAMTVIKQPGKPSLPLNYTDLSVEERLGLPRSYDCGAHFDLREVLTKTVGVANFSPSPVLFGNDIPARDNDFDINSYFSELLKWDDDHCYGLQARIFSARINRAEIHDEAYGWLWIAAEKWIEENRDSSPLYCRYPNFERSDFYEFEKYEC